MPGFRRVHRMGAMIRNETMRQPVQARIIDFYLLEISPRHSYKHWGKSLFGIKLSTGGGGEMKPLNKPQSRQCWLFSANIFEKKSTREVTYKMSTWLLLLVQGIWRNVPKIKAKLSKKLRRKAAKTLRVCANQVSIICILARLKQFFLPKQNKTKSNKYFSYCAKC